MIHPADTGWLELDRGRERTVKENESAVLGQVHVGLEAVRALADGRLEARQRVLRWRTNVRKARREGYAPNVRSTELRKKD